MKGVSPAFLCTAESGQSFSNLRVGATAPRGVKPLPEQSLGVTRESKEGGVGSDLGVHCLERGEGVTRTGSFALMEMSVRSAKSKSVLGS